ncbi:MAG: CDP-alcohol phosphatidyltransferase family protein [Anaerolineae bacterium]|nr:MAG: CDP-alcohol phosphatidyltransferase family protein [Anaerolineae bacterium]
MFDNSLRMWKDRLGTPLAERMEHVPPNGITWAALFLGLAAAGMAATGWYWGALVFWLLNRALDGLDGLLARLHEQQSDFGGYLDILLDFTVYALIPIGLAWSVGGKAVYLTLSLMLASFYVNSASWMYLAALLEKRAARTPETQTSVVMPAGLIGGFETVVAYCLFLCFPAQASVLFSGFAALVIFTAFQRLAWAWKAIT